MVQRASSIAPALATLGIVFGCGGVVAGDDEEADSEDGATNREAGAASGGNRGRGTGGTVGTDRRAGNTVTAGNTVVGSRDQTRDDRSRDVVIVASDDGGVGGAADPGARGAAGEDGGDRDDGSKTATWVCEDLHRAEGERSIDDFEDGDGVLPQRDGREGAWYTFHDESDEAELWPAVDAAFEPVADGHDSKYAAKLESETGGFIDWGAGMGIDFVPPDEGCGYDASLLAGISFCVRGTKELEVLVQVKVPAALPLEDGGRCDLDDDLCYNYPVSDRITLTAEWECYAMTWSEFGPAPWGPERTWDASNILGFEVRIEVDYAGDPFVVYLDDLAFFGN